MSVRPTVPWPQRPDRIQAGRPVRSRHAVALASRANAVMAYPRMLVPAHGPPHTLTAHTSTTTWRYAMRSWIGGEATELLIGAAVHGAGGSSTIDTTITTGSVPLYAASTIMPATGRLPLTVGAGLATYDVRITVPAAMDCYVWDWWIAEAPVESLTAGADINALLVDRPITRDSLLRTYQVASASSPDYMRRCLYCIAVTYDEVSPMLTTSTLVITPMPVPVVPRRIQSATTRVRCHAYGYGPSGTKALFDFGAAGSASVLLPATAGWADATIDLPAEDLLQPDGLPSGYGQLTLSLSSPGGTAELYTALVIEDE